MNRVLSDKVKRVISELARAYPPRVRGTEARRMLRRLKRESGCSRRQYRALWSRPEESFGPFGSLPYPLQKALGDAVGWEMRERSFTVSDRLHAAVYGPVFWLGSELAQVGRRIRARGGAWRSPGRVLFICGRLVTGACVGLGRGWLAATRFAPFTRTSAFHALWKWAGVDPVPLAVGYVEKIPYDPRMSPVYRLSGRKVESCALIGVDFLVSNGEFVYLEANFNPGMSTNRLKLYPEGDPVCKRLCRYAREHGFRRIVYYPTDIWFLREELGLMWREMAAAQRVDLEIRDDPHHRSPWRRSWKRLMDLDRDDTLYVNSRALPSPLSAVIREKGLLDVEIDRQNREAPESDRIRMSRTIRASEDVAAPDPDSRFPNLIVKHSLRDMASDHTLYKTERLPDGIVSPPYVVYEYVPPDRVVQVDNGSRAEFAFNYRAYLLITPQGPRYLGAKKNVGLVRVPDQLASGRVADNRPYVINSHLAATETAVTPAEDECIGPATLRVGRVIDAFLRRKHELVVASAAVKR